MSQFTPPEIFHTQQYLGARGGQGNKDLVTHSNSHHDDRNIAAGRNSSTSQVGIVATGGSNDSGTADGGHT